MQIPDEAVEAAADIVRLITGVRDPNAARLILEAAAPRMLAEAWEQGWESASGNYCAMGNAHQPVRKTGVSDEGKAKPAKLPNLSDDSVWAEFVKRAEGRRRESRRARRCYWLHQMFPWL